MAWGGPVPSLAAWAADAALALKVGQCFSGCLAPGAVVACDREMAGQGWAGVPLPDGARWPYFMYRNGPG